MKIRLFILIFFVFLEIACLNEKPIENKKMIKIMYDLNLENEYFKTYSYLDTLSLNPSYQNFTFNQILLQNNVTVADYEKTLQYFYKHPEAFKEFTDSLFQYAERQEKNIDLKLKLLKDNKRIKLSQPVR